MSDLVEKVRGIIETHIAACEPPDAIAREAIAAVAEWIETEAAYERERRVADILMKQLEASHG